MPPTKYAQSSKFAKLSANERARRISKIRDPRKRLKAEKFWGVEHGGGGGGFLDRVAKFGKHPAKVSRNLVGDVPQLFNEGYKTGKQVVGGVAEDVVKGRGLPGATAWVVSGGRTPGPWEYKKLSKAEQRPAGDILAEQIVKGAPEQLMLLKDPQAWYEDPGIQLLNVAAIALPGLRVASVARLARTIKAANPGMSRSMVNKAAVMESLHPGFVRAQGLAGGIKPRTIPGKYAGTSDQPILGRMPSRQPIIRGAQRAIDKQAERLDVTNPGSRWSASSKAQRMAAKRDAAAERLAKAKRKPLEDEVVKGLLGGGIKPALRRLTGATERTPRDRAAAMVAGLESPADLNVRQAAEVKVSYLHDVLEEDGQLRPMQDAVDDLKRQRDEAREVDPEVDTTILDQQIWHGQGKLDVLMGRGVPELDSPGRTKLYNAMLASLGRKGADKQIQQWDLAAWGNDLDNPTALYDKVDVQRLADPEMFRPTGTALYQKMAAGQGGWYFPLVRALEGMPNPEKTIQVGQLMKRLENAGVKREELRNSGLAQLAENADPSDLIAPATALKLLEKRSYRERFDPNIEIETDIEGGYNSATRYGPDDSPDGPVLNSREGEPGDYFEMVVDMDELEVRYGAGEGEGAGRRHWKIPNNVYHIRGQIFHEDGIKKLLIEEIQSDWGSDARRARREGQELPPSPMHESRYLQQAIHQIMRHADAENVDEVVITTGNTQAVRNGIVNTATTDSRFVEGKYYGAPGDEKAYAYHEFIDPEYGEPMTNDLIDSFLDGSLTDEMTSFPRLYDKEIPGLFKKLYGLEGEVFDDAYKGRFTAQPEPGNEFGDRFAGFIQPKGDMRGTVIRLTDEAKKKARQDKPLYQTDPAGEVKGATEFLADGRRRVTMFMGANATTWSHELIHVLTPDLTPEHRKVLETEIADGKPYEEWGTPEHEKLADAWDSYWRDGYAPPSLREVFADLIKRMKEIWRQSGHEAVQVNPATARTFDEMLGKRYNNTVVLKDHERAQVEADIADLRKALDSGDVDQMDEAVNALAELSHQAEVAGAKILTDGKTPEQAAAILEGLATRKNAVAEDFRRRGLLDSDEDAKGYFPHFSMWESIGAPPADPVRMSAVGDVVGTPKIPAKAINRNRNKLIRMQTGEVLNDPAVITYVLRARLRLQATIRARRDLYAIGDPIVRGQGYDRSLVYVRNPDVTPEKMHKATEAANRLSREDFRSLSARQQVDEIDEINDVDGMADEMFWDPSKDKRPKWVETEDTVRTVPGRIARNRLGDVFRSAPGGKGMAALGITNALFRMSSIYLRPWRYIPINYTQNAVMLALTNPRAFSNLIKRDVARLTKDDPELRAMIREQVGTIQATALPEFNIRPQNKMQGLERRLTSASGEMGEVLGRYADIPIREAAWLNHAGKYGFTDADDLRRLIDDPDLAEVRDIVSQRTKEDLIDFDTLTPYEKEVMTRWLALWPFIRGITKWPFMYAREYPMRVAGASLASGAVEGEETDITVQDMGTVDLFGKRVNIGKLDPSAPGREAIQNSIALMRGVSQVTQGKQPNLEAFGGNYLAPGVRELLGVMTNEGRKNWPKNMARTFVPFAGPLWLDPAKGGSLADQALRQMGLIRERTDGVRREVKEWMAPVDKVAKQMRAKGQTPPPLLSRMQKLRGPYGDWKQYESEAKFAHRDRGEADSLTKAERVVGLLDVAKEYYPQLYAQADASAKQSGWDSFEELAESGKMDPEQLEKIDRYLYDQMFGAMETMKRQAKEAGYDVE